MSASNDLFKELMRRFAAGVTLVTFNENGKLGGLTVSSFCSLSMDPPLVLICIDRKVASHESLEKTATFGVNICNSEQGKIAWDFANPKIDKNELFPWSLKFEKFVEHQSRTSNFSNFSVFAKSRTFRTSNFKKVEPNSNMFEFDPSLLQSSLKRVFDGSDDFLFWMECLKMNFGAQI